MQELEELFLEELADIYHAEKQLTKALPKMVKAARSEELQNAFQEHLEQTEEHVDRIEEVFRAFGKSPKAKKCEAMLGLVKEGDETAKEFKGKGALDAALIAAAQKVEHYEIASYGCLCTWAEMLENSTALRLLKATLGEEKETDESLTELAERSLNLEAAEANGGGGPRGRRKTGSRPTASRSR